MTQFEKLLKDQTMQEDQRFAEIGAELKTIKDNHLHHMELDMQDIKIQGIILKTDMIWVKWGILSILGALVAGGIGLIFVR